MKIEHEVSEDHLNLMLQVILYIKCNRPDAYESVRKDTEALVRDIEMFDGRILTLSSIESVRCFGAITKIILDVYKEE